MPKQNKQARLFEIFLVAVFAIFGVFSFTPQAQASDPNEEGDTYININQDTIWKSTDDLNLAKTVYVNPGATLTIEKGAKIKFGKDINGNDTYLSVDGGRLIAIGTQENPISITADADQQYYLIEFRRENWEGIPELLPSFLRYVEIYGGGYEWNTDCPECSGFLRKLIPSAYAAIEGTPAIFFAGGKVHIENSTFHNNIYADVGIQYDEFYSSTGIDNYLEIVNSNFEKNGNSMAIKSELWCQEAGSVCMNKIRLKNNWYDSPQGPYKTYTNENSDGKEILGNILLDGWRKNDLIVDPAVILPGIMGSLPKYAGVGGELVMEPILQTYENLFASLEKNGYTEDINLFRFPYEWRNSNIITAESLKNKIGWIKSRTEISKVDLVAHSMGGLVSRYYIESP
ncbi:MAG: hypothetical protein AAB487_03415, partial [Patescibacteria group bacterium]